MLYFTTMCGSRRDNLTMRLSKRQISQRLRRLRERTCKMLLNNELVKKNGLLARNIANLHNGTVSPIRNVHQETNETRYQETNPTEESFPNHLCLPMQETMQTEESAFVDQNSSNSDTHDCNALIIMQNVLEEKYKPHYCDKCIEEGRPRSEECNLEEQNPRSIDDVLNQLNDDSQNPLNDDVQNLLKDDVQNLLKDDVQNVLKDDVQNSSVQEIMREECNEMKPICFLPARKDYSVKTSEISDKNDESEEAKPEIKLLPSFEDITEICTPSDTRIVPHSSADLIPIIDSFDDIEIIHCNLGINSFSCAEDSSAGTISKNNGTKNLKRYRPQYHRNLQSLNWLFGFWRGEAVSSLPSCPGLFVEDMEFLPMTEPAVQYKLQAYDVINQKLMYTETGFLHVTPSTQVATLNICCCSGVNKILQGKIGQNFIIFHNKANLPLLESPPSTEMSRIIFLENDILTCNTSVVESMQTKHSQIKFKKIRDFS